MAKISVSIPENKLKEVDSYCEKNGISRSKLLVRGALQIVKKDSVSRDIKLGEYKEDDFASRKSMAKEIEKDVGRVMENTSSSEFWERDADGPVFVDRADRKPGKKYKYVPSIGKYKEV